MNRRDGYEPVDLYPYLSGIERWSAPLRSLITLPYLFEKRKGEGGAPRNCNSSRTSRPQCSSET